MNTKNIREGFVETCQDFRRLAAGYNYIISDQQWRKYIGSLKSNFASMEESAKEALESPYLPQIKRIRISFYGDLERGVGLYYQKPEILFELIFVYLVQEWQVFLDEITQREFENEPYYKKFERVKEKLGVMSFPTDLAWKIRLYVEVRNNLQHSRRKLRKRDLDKLEVKEFELLDTLNGTTKKYKAGDTVTITIATVFEATRKFIEAAKELVP